VPFGRERTGVLLRAAAHAPPPDEWLQRVEAVLGLEGSETLRYADRRRGRRRAMRLVRHDGELRLQAFLLAGDTTAEPWVRALLQQELPAQAYGRLLLAPGGKAPVAVRSAGRQVCSCFDVSDLQIRAELDTLDGTEDERLQALQSALRCGTSCGSCLPQLRRMVRAAPVPQQSGP
jgi:assimilatory nitrate reductase catalytic subunit